MLTSEPRVTLRQEWCSRKCDVTYKVVTLINTTTPKVGSEMSESDIRELMNLGVNVKIQGASR